MIMGLESKDPRVFPPEIQFSGRIPNVFENEN